MNKNQNIINAKTRQDCFCDEIDKIKLFKNFQELLNNIKYVNCQEYINIRPNIIKALLKFNNIYHYSKKVFYLAILYLDIIFQSLPENTILDGQYEIYIINCIILAAKFYEDDLKSTSFERFIDFSKNQFDLEDIALNEIICLKILNYKLNYNSIFDILNFLMEDYMTELNIGNNDDYYSISN